MSEFLIEARDVTVHFGDAANGFDAVRDATVQVQAGETVGIVGESGSGKTTLARVFVGLQAPTRGVVALDGVPTFGAATRSFPRSERWKVQMVFQDPYSSLNPRQRAWSSVAEAVRVWKRVSKSAAKEEALKLLGAMGLGPEQAEKYPASLSGGQRQRVSVARALAPGPLVLIADEPTSAIDQSAQAQLLNLLRQVQKSRGLAIIFISHDLSIIRYLASRVYVMRRGEIVETGPTGSVFASPRHEYTRLLLASIPGRRVGGLTEG